MLLRLALDNLRKFLGRASLLVVSVAVGVMVLTVFGGAWLGLRSAVSSGTENKVLTVRPDAPSALVQTVTNEPTEFTDEEVAKISELPEVSKVTSLLFLRRAATAEADMDLGPWSGTFLLDMMVYGADENLFDGEEFQKDFTSDAVPIPVVMSTRILDLYNLFIAEQTRLPSFKESDFVGRKFDLLLDYSEMLHLGSREEAWRLPCQVVGFSDNVEMAGITVPNGVLKNWSHRGEAQPYALRLMVDDPLELESLEETLTNWGYRVEVDKGMRTLEQMSFYVALILMMLGGVVWVTIVIALMTTFVAVTRERKQ